MASRSIKLGVDTIRIYQIIPASSGWYAYYPGKGVPLEDRLPIAAWALVVKSRMETMERKEAGTGCICDARTEEGDNKVVIGLVHFLVSWKTQKALTLSEATFMSLKMRRSWLDNSL